MFKAVLFIIALSIGTMTSVASELSLPNYTIKASNSPCSVWLGKWAGGKWDGRRPGALVVTSVSSKGADCVAEAIVVWGVNPKKPDSPGGYAKVTGSIRGNVLTFKGKDSTTTYTLKNSTLSGKNVGKKSFIKLKRQ